MGIIWCQFKFQFLKVNLITKVEKNVNNLEKSQEINWDK